MNQGVKNPFRYENASTLITVPDVATVLTGEFPNECRSMRNYLEAKEKESFENTLSNNDKSTKSHYKVKKMSTEGLGSDNSKKLLLVQSKASLNS